MLLTLPRLHELCVRALIASKTSPENARCVADALVAAEADGQKGHGASRVPSYAAQAACGKVDGFATPVVERTASASIRIDAANGFAFPAMRAAVNTLAGMTSDTGIASAAVTRSHHFGAAGYHVEQLAQRGMIGLVFGNSPKAIAPWGGREALPIAFAAPRPSHPPLVIDLSLSKVARGKIMVASQQGQPIPEGWALDAQGQPTTDAKAALAGTMLPLGDAKGYALVLMVEILAAALTGAHFGYEASSFFDTQGGPPGVGQFLIAIHPDRVSGGVFAQRLEQLIQAIESQDGARLPGMRRLTARARAQKDGVDLPEDLVKQIEALAT